MTCESALQPSFSVPTHPHGAWADSSSWDGVITRLRSLRYHVVAPPNPLRGVRSDAAYLADYLKTVKGPIVLVGHSYGGMVITNAALGNAHVKALVYIDAFIPAKGQSPQVVRSSFAQDLSAGQQNQIVATQRPLADSAVTGDRLLAPPPGLPSRHRSQPHHHRGPHQLTHAAARS
jgi:pimeloyl-ACP methyl ester carboxylesterase